MNHVTLAQSESKESALVSERRAVGERSRDCQASTASVRPAQTVIIAATFTADLLEPPLQLWMRALDIAADVVLAPYAQIMQELLNPASVLAQNRDGFNVLLIRVEDWIRDRQGYTPQHNLDHLRSCAGDLTQALRSFRARSGAALFVVLCPSSAGLPDAYRDEIEKLQRELASQLEGLAHTHCWTHADVLRLYAVEAHEDTRADRIGHIPYTREYFAALASVIARRICVLVKPQYKVIALDCDNTLWKGICGEDGPGGIELSPAHLDLQKLLVQQYEAGVLLCLCSKNNPADVEAVFQRRPDMILREEHLICSRINWNAKSANLRSLAEELNLGLDSFIFIDDSALECAEVEAHCPGVLTLRMPQTAGEVEHFLKHVWAFDRVGVTREAKQRTLQYKQNRARSKALEQATDLEQFLASLELKVDIATMQPDHLARAAELVQRTNQFNLTTIRRRASEIESLCKADELRSLVVHVSDRFGDYGLVGVVLYRRHEQSLAVDTFVLSCRVLGRGVEHRIVNELGRIAREDGLLYVRFEYRPTPRNAPAREFLEGSFARFRVPTRELDANHVHFMVPAQYAQTLGAQGSLANVVDEKPAASHVAGGGTVSTQWHQEALRLSHLTDLIAELDLVGTKRGNVDTEEYVAPRTPMEQAVAKIWAQTLGLEDVSVVADFFHLGGNSLLAVQVISSIGAVLGLELSIYDFFDGPTVAEVASKLAGASSAESAIERVEYSEGAPLSSAQQRLWFIDRLEGGTTAYHLPLLLRLYGTLDRAALRAALDSLLRRHEALRTVFVEIDGTPFQRVRDSSNFSLIEIDLSARPAPEREAEVELHTREEIAVPFDLSAGPLIRGRLLQLSADDHVLLVTMHHIVSDGWSIGVLIDELGALYQGHREGNPDCLPELPIQYADYAHWQQQRLNSPEQQEQLAFWKEHLRDAPELLELPTDRPRPKARSYAGDSVHVALGPQLTEDLKALSRQLDLTLAMTLFGAWAILLSRLSGQDDIVVGMPVANRRRAEIEGLIGFFVNTLAVRVTMEDDPTLPVMLGRVRRVMLDAYAHQDVPFEQVVEALQPARSLSYSPIFQAMFVMQNASRGEVTLPGLKLSEQEVFLETSQFDVTLWLREGLHGIEGRLTYSTDLFDRSTIERWLGLLNTLLASMVRESQQTIGRLPILDAREREQVLEGFNTRPVAYPREALVHQLFEAQVQRTPDAPAVVYQDRALTFAELNARANQLARHLRSKGVGPDELVALCVERSVEMIVGLLGALKAGGGYLPLDPEYPSDRLAYMVEDARPRVVLVEEGLRARLPDTAAEVVALDRDWPEIAARDASNLDAHACGVHSHHLAYVIYTSGSTGRPKGVMIEHRNLTSLWQGLEHIYRQSGGCERIGVNASVNFDASVKQIVQLLSGRALVIVPQDERRDAPRLLRYLREQRINGIDCTPWQLKSWLEAGLLDSDQHELRVVLIGGEPIAPELWATLAQANVDFYNVYGPTESTVDATYALIRGDTSAPHIGRSMENRRIYILDRHGVPVPIGVSGEIHIGGAGVARGYLRRAELSAERFVSDPFSPEPNARMYKSGDVGRWRADGTIEYTGRNDLQVKIRGFRIELGEIEAELARHEQVREAVVIVREDSGDRRLVAYVVAANPSAPASAESLRAHVRGALPEYMVPSAYVTLESMPLTANGKLNRRALPTPQMDAYASREYEAPQGEVEEILASAWQALLGLERVGRQDNFFELGGHSLLIVQMLERLRRVGLSAEVRSVFESPTLADLARALTREAHTPFQAPPNLIPAKCARITPQMLPLTRLNEEQIERIVQRVPGGVSNIQDIYPLAPLQEGILFQHLMNERGADAYVLPTLLSVASRSRLAALVEALQSAIDRHDVLRTMVLWERLPEPVQVVCRRATLRIDEITLDAERSVTEQLDDWLKPERQRLDLRQAPLLRLQVASDPRSGQLYVLLQIHHIVADGLSLTFLISEVMAQLEGRPLVATDTAHYRDHVAQALASAATHDAQAFFRAKLADVGETTAPFGLFDVHGDGSRIEELTEVLESDLALRIRAQARRLSVSAATLFHAAWALIVARTSGREDVVFGTVLLGRLQGTAGAQRVLGMFINTLPLRLRLQGVTTEELIRNTQRELVELLSHEQASLAVAQRCSGLSGSAPLFTALLNYRHGSRRAEAGWGGAEGIRVIASHGFTNYPMTLSVDDMGEGFALTAQTDRRIDPHRVTAFLRTAMTSLLDALEQAPQMPALELNALPDGERRHVIEVLNATRAERSPRKLIHELFEEQAARAPACAAVMHGDRVLTYGELNAQANQLARHLRGKGVGPGELAGVCIERSPEMLIAVLAILKAGAAYVPLDPNYPTERLRHMVADAAPKVVLTQASLHDKVPSRLERLVMLDEVLPQLAAEATDNLPAAQLGLTADALVYVIYTSGSTGRPKGTAMQHGAMSNLMEWHRKALPLNQESRVLQFAALSFDVAFQDTFSTLCAGGTLVLLDEWVRRDARALLDLLSARSIERVFVPPLMLQSLAECSKRLNVVPASLQDVITAGEQLRITPEIVQLFAQVPSCRLHNHYGPTETHVVTALTLEGNSAEWPTLPTIGRPIANTQIYILDARRRPVPLGVSGDIYIAGANLARGYLHRDDLTRERFVRDPFSTDPHARMYKTGDVGRWCGDGTIEYLGRNDDQVKLRGFRIEPSEIEAQLGLHPGVKEAAVIAREDVPGEKRLVAYIVAHPERVPNAEELRAHLRNALPDYMVPGAFVTLESLPLTPSGKLDRRALPAPHAGAYAVGHSERPQGEAEEALARMWQELLHVECVGRDDNFFELGGHSLLVLKSLFTINEFFGSTLKVSDVYNSPTVRGLAARLLGANAGDDLVDLARESAWDPSIIALPGTPRTPAKVILLTGATGFVGRFLLTQLLEDTDATIHCLVRARSQHEAAFRLRTTLAQWDLWRDEYEPRIVAIPGDLRLPRLGLSEEAHRELAAHVDAIYHCATSMNHLETYAMAKAANVDAAWELLRLATCGRPKVINYMSTTGVFGTALGNSARVVDERTSIDDERHSMSRGYVASKWVGEKIFMTADKKGIPCNIFRLGLVWADTEQGRYDELQRGYRLLKSCLLSGCGIRHYQYESAPLPVDFVARAIVHLAKRHCGGRGIFHIAASSQAVDDVFARCNEILGARLELMPFYDWVCEIKRLHREGYSLPVVPLFEYAFSMDEDAFYDHQRTTRAARPRVDCARTNQELALAGIVAPVLDDELLRVCLEGMLARDKDLQEWRDRPDQLLVTSTRASLGAMAYRPRR